MGNMSWTNKTSVLTRPVLLILLLLPPSLSEARHHEETVLKLRWGSGQYAVGLKRRADGAKFGPGALDVTDNGTIYILDSVNKAVKVYSANGQFLHGFPVALTGILGHMDVDSYENIWINNSEKNELLKYDRNGELVERLLYNPGKRIRHDPGISVHEDTISLSFSTLARNGEAPELSRNGETVHRTECIPFRRYGSIGQYSGNNYRAGLTKDKQPEIIVRKEKEVQFRYTFEELDDSFGVSFIGEDIDGNSYFKLASLIRKTARIYRFTPRMALSGQVPSLPFYENRQYLGIRDLVVNSRGAIVYLCMGKNGVKVMRWTIN